MKDLENRIQNPDMFNLILINQILEEAYKNRNHAEFKELVKNCFGAELKSEELLEISNKIAILDG